MARTASRWTLGSDPVEQSRAKPRLPFGRTSTGPHEAEDVIVDFVLDKAGATADVNGLRQARLEVGRAPAQPGIQCAAADVQAICGLVNRQDPHRGAGCFVHVRATSCLLARTVQNRFESNGYISRYKFLQRLFAIFYWNRDRPELPKSLSRTPFDGVCGGSFRQWFRQCALDIVSLQKRPPLSV